MRSGIKESAKAFHGRLKKSSPEDHMQCPQCGWPDIGQMPVGVSSIKQDNKTVLVGHLSYVRMTSELCSVCEDMKSAVAVRSWFLEAHREYLDQLKVKDHLLRGI
jgi:hypothetical protein